MRKYVLSVFFLGMLAIAVTLACGSSPPAYLLQSVSLSPATIDAQGNPVQFTATGYFNQQPSPAQLVSANWGVCYQNQPTAAVSVSTDGLAQCSAGAVGIYTVWAWAEHGGVVCGGVAGTANPVSAVNPHKTPANLCGGAGECQVTGTAQLTCP